MNGAGEGGKVRVCEGAQVSIATFCPRQDR